MKRIFSLFLPLALSFASMATAATVFTDGLLIGPGDTYNTALAGNFTASSGNVDVLQLTGAYGFLCSGAATCIDLDGDTQGAISSGNLTLTPGDYILTFTLDSAQRAVTASTTVSLGSLFNQTYNDPAPGLVVDMFSVANLTTAPLLFASNTAGTIGDILSGVSLETIPSTAPEPSTGLLICLPLLAFGGQALRRAKACAKVFSQVS